MLTNLLREKLPIISERRGREQFGNRDFLGASDVGKCERQFLLSKLTPPQYSPEELIRFYRGHLAETLLIDVFNETSYQWDAQKQYVHPENDKIRATTDFLFHTKKWDKIGVAECKSVSGLPSEPYDSWVAQLYFQMGMVQLHYPQAEVKGCLLCIDFNTGQFVEFEGFVPNEAVFKSYLDKAQRLLQLWESQDINGAGTEKSPLCKYCHYKADCPAFTVTEMDGVLRELALEYKSLKAQSELLSTEMDKIKETILSLYPVGTKVSDGEVSITISQVADSVIVDSGKLKKEFPEIYSQVIKTKKGYIKLTIE